MPIEIFPNFRYSSINSLFLYKHYYGGYDVYSYKKAGI